MEHYSYMGEDKDEIAHHFQPLPYSLDSLTLFIVCIFYYV